MRGGTRTKLRWLGLASGGTTLFGGLALAYAHYLEPYWLQENHYRVSLSGKAGAKSAWQGYRVAFLSDLHIAPQEEPLNTLTRAFERTLALRPDLVVLGGDYFSRGQWNPALSRLISPLTHSGLLVVAIMGNHDYFGRRCDPERIIDNLHQLGVKVLRNQALQVYSRGEYRWIVGLDDHHRGEPNLTEATEKLAPGERPLLVVSHNPDYVSELPPNYTELVLSGHTHGGQVNPMLPPFHKRFNWIRYTYSSHRTRYPVGWYTIKGNRLYVSRGLGLSGLRLRFNSRPELTIFEFI
ncbi:MAG: metallophosphoesterase [Chloroflexota bacterium]|nr:metallophosphoesterase [Chloroflexota bacterium]